MEKGSHMTLKGRRLVAAMAGPTLLAAGLLAAGPAQSATADTDPGARVLNCLVDMDAPTGGGGRVSARVATTGCSAGVGWRVELQSSRWYGWHKDAEHSWTGSQTHVLTAGCAGVHDHRLVVWATADGNTSPAKAGPQARIDCG
jgi:hypothetical protein